ncbi:OLC1v1030195C1 [Oldenlandia corymbosa var. corymbosa]|uniref:OLC1v1030195C1 n=1 Tax=Oldenlandia corymbosa var. corymbosa TaxID=529605 RepID=A0AAV1CFC8_OLDCO|nr:OLC1v1030195C1 [Oldenlandia corymbosa var. corymbosa]
MSSSNAGSRFYGDKELFHVVNSDEETSTTTIAGKKKKKRIVKGSEKEQRKKGKADVHATELAVGGEKVVPLATEKTTIPPMGHEPSNKTSATDKGKVPLKEEAIILPSHIFQGGPTIAVHMFGNPPTIECSLLEEFAAQLTETDCVRLNWFRLELRGTKLIKKVALEEKAQQVEAKEQELASVQAKYNELDEKLKEYGNLNISKEDLHKWCAASWFRMLSTGGMAAVIEEMNMAATEYGGHAVAVAGLKRLKSEKPVKAKWFKQFLKESLKKTMHEALVKALTKLSDTPTILARGPGEEISIPEVSDKYIGIKLEDGDDLVSEEEDAGNSGAKDNEPPVKGNTGGATGSTPHSHEDI